MEPTYKSPEKCQTKSRGQATTLCTYLPVRLMGLQNLGPNIVQNWPLRTIYSDYLDIKIDEDCSNRFMPLNGTVIVPTLKVAISQENLAMTFSDWNRLPLNMVRNSIPTTNLQMMPEGEQ